MKKLKVLFVYANCMMDNLIPVGASAVIGSLKNSGIDMDIKLFDTTFYRTDDLSNDEDRTNTLQVKPFDYSAYGVGIKKENVFIDFRRLVEGFKPDVIMISMVEVTYPQGTALLESVKDIKPYVIAGGVFPMLAREEVINNSLIDAVCIGEGEDAMPEFCRRFAAGEDFTGIDGMWFKEESGNIIKDPIKKLVDLNKAAFLDFSLYERGRFYKPMQGKIFRMVPLEFSRGCPYKCSYCANHALEDHFKSAGKWYRWKSMDRIFAEIEEYIKKYDVEFFYFVSETFLSMPDKKFDEFCERYLAYKIPFWFNTRPETITERKLRKLEEIGCFRMGIGLEHGSQEFRKKMLDRNVSNERIVEACKLVESSKITYSINNIIGFPGETREKIFETISLNRKINPDTVGTFVFTPFKGTKLYDFCLERGYIAPGEKAGDLNRGSVLKNNTLSDMEIRGLLRTFPLYVHFEEETFPEIEKAERFTEEGNKIFKSLADRYMKEHFDESKK